ncbi:hypothetical protein F0562_010834 [Nyssa sinensis]|uniref:PGG domain-containing protein n=1 Tax=Nyssa sinensis TaxID=561372 RepID=A0A5J5A3Q7_9ASTE|nr:hypothetical protein F0562_010834 [Nyssa sinensis]
MALTTEDEKELYIAVMKEEEDKVLQLCRKFPKGPLCKITIHDDTVLHMAIYSEQSELVLDLLKELPENHFHRLTKKNKVGNTILHEAATSDKLVGAAAEVLSRAPELLEIENNYTETALFRAARYGKIRMFKFLEGEVNRRFTGQADRRFYQRQDGATILHASILASHYELAHYIARKYEYLVSERDEKGMTALQHVSRDETTFKGSGRRYQLMRLIKNCVSTDQDTTAREEDSSCWRVSLWEGVRKEKRRYDSALKLAKFLIEKDTSWKDTEQLADVEEESSSAPLHEEEDNGEKTPKGNESSTANDTSPTPLLLATRHGCMEIVREILNKYPQAVEHVDGKGRTILHIAIKHRQMEILDMVEKMKIPMKKLARKSDDFGNSILHMVGKKAKNCMVDDMQSPALQLQDDLLLFERIQKICSAHFFRHINKKGKTAEEIFAMNNNKLRGKAKEWLKRTAENCSLVAVLIATVAFAAAYTVPGGSSDTGVPILLNQPFFVIFTITDVLSLTFALTSVIVFLSILTSPFRLNDFKQSLPQKLMLGFTFLIFSVSMMMFAFAATIILMIHGKQEWTKVALYTVAFLPVCIFAFSYLPLYVSLLKTLEYTVNKIVAVFPKISNIPTLDRVRSSIRSRESKVAIPSNPAQTQASSSTCPPRPQATHSLV